MATKKSEFKYDYGDVVRVLTTAPSKYSPGKIGSVCGRRNVEQERLYLVEFANGEEAEVPEPMLSIPQLC